MKTYCAILCGGDGKRLWPTSRKSFPKQFLPLVEGYSLFQLAFRRALRTSLPEHIFLVTIEDYRHNALKQAREVIPSFPEGNLIIRPDSKETFAVIACALAAMVSDGAAPEDVLICAPSDHLIYDEKAYSETMHKARSFAEKDLVVVGITPNAPSSDYGYIEVNHEERGKDGAHVVRFTEKPNAEKAAEYLANGNYLWNAGIYTGSLGAFTEAINTFEPDSGTLIQSGLPSLLQHFSKLADRSFDYSIAEKTTALRIVAATFDWSDLGSHRALIPVHNHENGSEHRHEAFDTENTLVDAKGKLVVTLGVKDLTIVDVNDVLLVMHRSKEQELTSVLAQLRTRGCPEVDHHYRGYRPWGHFEILEQFPNFLVKKITVSPGSSSLTQAHEGRSEHWVIVSGIARVTLGDESRLVHQHESVFVPAGTKHRIANPGTEPLVIIEIQTGNLDEENIKRFPE